MTPTPPFNQPGAQPSFVRPANKRDQAVRTMRQHLAGQRHDEALALFRSLPDRIREDPELLFVASMCHEARMHFPRAIELAQKSHRKNGRFEPLMVIARCQRALGETESALETLDKVHRLIPQNDVPLFLRAGVLEEAGRFAEATELLQPIVERYEQAGRERPTAMLLEWAKLLVQNKRFDEGIDVIDELCAVEKMPEPAVNQLLHLKAKACDRKKDFAGAWDAADRANEIGRLEFSPDLYEEQVTTLIENWSREAMEKFPISSCESELPVFVAGMPRSGTSLIDQIIDAHPKAAGVGELATIEAFAKQLAAAYDSDKEPPACFGRYNALRWTRAANEYIREIEKLSPPGVERVVNKALGNNKLVGLIARLFPKTRIIHAIRDPRDVAISCFMGGFNNRLHPWTTRVEWAARAWEQSMRMMEHWKSALDIPILDVHYERLVADPESEFPRIIDFLGLEWDDRCFEFHKSRRTVRTLSYDQVNRPLYTSSSGRHANYAEQIAGVEFPSYDPYARDE
ncbi:MAG: hypothetical protein Tsb0013_00870 [Phycisphaerales bacterium]